MKLNDDSLLLASQKIQIQNPPFHATVNDLLAYYPVGGFPKNSDILFPSTLIACLPNGKEKDRAQ